MQVQFEATFLTALTKHASLKNLVRKKVDMIIENPLAMGEPLKGNWQGFYSCPVKRNFLIIYHCCLIVFRRVKTACIQRVAALAA
jgi:addiction module RelE/StbE family toxin